jgi:hypothetical protein
MKILNYQVMKPRIGAIIKRLLLAGAKLLKSWFLDRFQWVSFTISFWVRIKAGTNFRTEARL